MAITDYVRGMWADFFKMLGRDVQRWWYGIGVTPGEKVRLAEEAIADGDRHADKLLEMLEKAKADWSREWKRAGGVEQGIERDETGDSRDDT